MISVVFKLFLDWAYLIWSIQFKNEEVDYRQEGLNIISYYNF